MICGGDFNANIGGIESGEHVCGEHGTRKQNKAGAELRQVLNLHEMYSPMTFHVSSYKGTWLHPRLKQHHQLDHLFVKQKDKKLIRKCKIANMLIDSDHFSVRLHVSILSPAGRSKTTRQKRNKKDFQGRYGRDLGNAEVEKASFLLNEAYQGRRQQVRQGEEGSTSEEGETEYQSLQLVMDQ